MPKISVVTLSVPLRIDLIVTGKFISIISKSLAERPRAGSKAAKMDGAFHSRQGQITASPSLRLWDREDAALRTDRCLEFRSIVAATRILFALRRPRDIKGEAQSNGPMSRDGPSRREEPPRPRIEAGVWLSYGSLAGETSRCSAMLTRSPAPRTTSHWRGMASALIRRGYPLSSHAR